MTYITASKLYNYTQCPHRVWRDVHGPLEEKIEETNAFVKLLWEKGLLHEEKIVKNLGSYVNLEEGDLEERFNRTVDEMQKGTELIYQGVIRHGNLLGIPDLLEKTSEGKYIPTDIKSGKGLEGEDDLQDGNMKKHYAVQLCLYVDVLISLGFCNEKTALVIDSTGKKIEYDLEAPQGVRNRKTWWQEYLDIKDVVNKLIENTIQNKPASAGICKLCHWYVSCKKWCKDSNDLSNVFYLGRSKRDQLNSDLGIVNVKELCDVNVSDIIARKKNDKSFMKGFGEKLLTKYIQRAKILSKTKKPVAYGEINLPKVSTELFFDIEDDPMQDFVYLHGVYERKNGEERFLAFWAKESSIEGEKNAWDEFWKYIRSLPVDDYSVYYFSHHEKTTYKKMREKYPDVVSESELNAFFENPNVIDLYQFVFQHTDWPLSSYSLKELAVYLGFKWRDESPSGALSIQWYNDYLESGSDDLLKRILEYNEDDCKATMVLKDGLVKLKT